MYYLGAYAAEADQLDWYQMFVPSTAALLFYLALCVLMIIAQWKIFEKAGEAGWKILIPFYNSYIIFRIAWGKPLYFLLMFIPFVNVVVGIILTLKLSKAFGKSTGFFLGLLFLQPIFMLILGFDNSKYIGPDGVQMTDNGL